MSKRTLFLIFALFLITFVLLIMAFYQPQAAPKVTRIIPTPVSVAQTVLSFGNPTIATTSSITTLNYSLPVNIDTATNRVTSVQLELQYDPAVLTNVKVSVSPLITKPDILLNQIDPVTGRITYAFGVGLTGKSITGKQTVAYITFSAKAKTLEKTAIIFLPKSLVAAENVSQSVLKRTTDGLFTVGEVSSTGSALSQ